MSTQTEKRYLARINMPLFRDNLILNIVDHMTKCHSATVCEGSLLIGKNIIHFKITFFILSFLEEFCILHHSFYVNDLSLKNSSQFKRVSTGIDLLRYSIYFNFSLAGTKINGENEASC